MMNSSLAASIDRFTSIMFARCGTVIGGVLPLPVMVRLPDWVYRVPANRFPL